MKNISTILKTGKMNILGEGKEMVFIVDYLGNFFKNAVKTIFNSMNNTFFLIEKNNSNEDKVHVHNFLKEGIL